MLKLKPGFQYIDRKEINLKGIENIILMGDVGCTGFDNKSKLVFGKILCKKTDLFFILGDLVYSGTLSEFNEVVDFCGKKAKAPIFTLCGNHDMPDYSRAFGFSSYALILEEYVILALDNSVAPFSKEDLLFLERELKKYKTKKNLIFFHVPPPNNFQSSCMKNEEWTKIRRILDKFRGCIESIFCAHIHAFQEYYLDGYHIFITGGAGARYYKLEKDPLKQHHAIRLNLEGALRLKLEIIKIGKP